MKTNFKYLLVLLFITPFSLFAQFNWELGGNDSVFPNAVTAGNNTLGTNINLPMRIATNSTERFKIMPFGTTNADGRIAMGNNLAVGFTPLSRLHLHQTAAVNTIRFTTDNMLGGNGFEVGYDATSNIINQQYAEIHNRENTAIKVLDQ